MKQFYVRFCIILSICLSGYVYPALAETQSIGGYGYSNGNNSGSLSVEDQLNTNSGQSDWLPASTGTMSLPTADPANNGNTLLKSGPPGIKGDPISGVTPIGHGFQILIALSFLYLLYITMFIPIKKKKMNKSVVTFLILLAVSITHAYGQAVSDSTLLKRITFGSGSANPCDSVIAKDTLAFEGVETAWAYCKAFNTRMPDNSYLLANKVSGNGTATWCFPVWWGYGTGATLTPSFLDHTSNGTDPNGYFLIANTASDTSKYIMRFSIGSLCPNSRLYISAYLGNLVMPSAGITTGSIGTKYFNPKLRFRVVDAHNLTDTIGMYNMEDTIPKTASPLWQHVGFPFTSKSDSIVLLVYNDTPETTGNDLAMDDVEVWLNHITINSIPGPKYYCLGEKMKLSVDYSDPSGTYPHPGIKWFYSANSSQPIELWDSVGVGQNYTGVMKNEPGFYKVVVGDSTNVADNLFDCCSVSDAEPVYLNPPTTLYWKQTPQDDDWNNPDNWLLDGTTPVPYAPGSCNDVHIPGNSSTYPSLNNTTTKDACACNDIWFHFGGLIAQPQLLNYHYAYVQYNFGGGSDPYSAPPMNRVGSQQWYALAAPLQRMASGDFSFCGYPSMWQMRFETTHQSDEYGTLGTGDYAQWNSPENINSWAIADQYNAIAIWADDDSPDSSTGLDKLNGILEIPFYESPDTIYHRGFYQIGTTSYFQYYNDFLPDRPFLTPADQGYKDPGSIDRGTDIAYKFIFEDNTRFDKTGNGIYSMKNVPSSGEIMVGNPFMSDLNFDKFVEDNGHIFDTYRLYVNNSFQSYSYTAGSPPDPLNMQYIAPLQAFFITPNQSALTFNANTETVTPATPNTQLKASVDNTKEDVLYMQASSKSGASRLTLSMQQNVKVKNLSLLLPQGYPEVPQLYATDASGQRNSIQFEGGYVDSIPLGIFSTDSVDQVTLTVSNKDKVNTNYLSLVDKYLKKTTDLKTTDTYTFTNVPGIQDRFLLMFVNNSLLGIPPAAINNPTINVSASDDLLYVNAATEIEDVSVITLQGITVVKDNNIGQPSYTKSLQLPAGLYLVSVKLKTGETNVAKVVIK